MQVGTQFNNNQVSWTVLEMKGSWAFCEGKRSVPGQYKPMILWDCCNVPTGPNGEFMVPASLGAENSKLNLDKKEIYARYLRGLDQLNVSKQRKANEIQRQKDCEIAEQKRLDFLSSIEAKKQALLTEVHQIYDETSDVEKIASNKKLQENLKLIAGYETIRLFYNTPINYV